MKSDTIPGFRESEGPAWWLRSARRPAPATSGSTPLDVSNDGCRRSTAAVDLLGVFEIHSHNQVAVTSGPGLIGLCHDARKVRMSGMLALIENWWVPALSVVLGSVVTVVTTLIADWRRWEREDNKERVQAETKARQERRWFDQEAVVRLQENGAALAAAAGIFVTAREADASQEDLAKANQAWRDALIPYLVLSARVEDQELRRLAKECRLVLGQSRDSEDQSEAEMLSVEGFAIFEELNDRAGELLRSLDRDLTPKRSFSWWRI